MIHSLSKLGTFEQCAAKYKFKYIDNLPTPPSTSAGRGIDTHSMIELYLKTGEVMLNPPLDFYQGWLDGLRKVEGASPEAKLALDVDWNPCDWNSEVVWWRGVLDLLIPPQGQKVHVYDWKTGKIYDDHEDQREIYGVAALSHYPEATEVTCTHVYVDLHKSVTKTYHRDHLDLLKTRWGRRFRAVETATEFPYNPQFKCRWCPFSKESGGPCPF